MFTAPDVARQGVGRAILIAAEDAARAVGFAGRGSAPRRAARPSIAAGYVEIGRETALPDGPHRGDRDGKELAG